MPAPIEHRAGGVLPSSAMKVRFFGATAVLLSMLVGCDGTNNWRDADWDDGADGDGDGDGDSDGDADSDADSDADADEDGEVPSIGGGDAPDDVIPRAVIEPTVDGRLREWPPLRYRLDTDTTARRDGPVQRPTADDAQLLFDLRWTDQALYFAAAMGDDEAIVDSDLVWEDDSVELYVDGDNLDEAPFYMDNDHQYTVVRDGRFADRGAVIDPASRGIVHAVTTDGPDYALEIAVPWSELTGTPSVGRLLGIDVAFNDDDDGEFEDTHFVMWLAHEITELGGPVQDTSLFRDLALGE